MDNIVIPQNDLPLVNVEMARIPLVAKARRVAIPKFKLNYLLIYRVAPEQGVKTSLIAGTSLESNIPKCNNY